MNKSPIIVDIYDKIYSFGKKTTWNAWKDPLETTSKAHWVYFFYEYVITIPDKSAIQILTVSSKKISSHKNKIWCLIKVTVRVFVGFCDLWD